MTLPLNHTLLSAAISLLGTATGRIPVDDVHVALTKNEEERIALRDIMPLLGWRRRGGAYVRHTSKSRLMIQDGKAVPLRAPAPREPTEIQRNLAAAFGDMLGRVTNADAWKATGSKELYTVAMSHQVAAAMRAIGFERSRLRFDRKVSIVYVRGRRRDDRARHIFVYRDAVTGVITVTYEKRSHD